MSGWIKTTIGEQITLQRGFDITAKDHLPGNIRVISSGGTSGYHNRAMASGPGVITGRKGTLGTVFYVEDDYWPHDTTLWVKDFHGNHPRFVYYFLKTLDFLGMNVGSSNPTLNRNHVHPIEVIWPPLEEQHAIAHILGSLDDKIELNRKMNVTLEATARAIFKSWFVDFDPVRAKANGEQPIGMDAEIAALFPNSFEGSELGLIPAGWRVAPIGEHIEAIKGLSYKGDGLRNDGFPLHNLNSIYEGGGYKHEGMKFYEGDYKPRHIAKSGDVIVANTEQGHNLLLIGYPAIIPERYKEGLFSHHLFRVRPLPDSPLTTSFLYYLLITNPFHEAIAGYTNGTTVNMLPSDALEKPLFVVPPHNLVKVFDSVVRPILQGIDRNHEASETLTVLRDALLPKLISGEISLGEATING